MKWIFLVFCVLLTVLCSATEESEHKAAVKLERELFEAIEYGNVSEVQSLIDRGVKLNGELYEKPIVFPLHTSISVHTYGRFNEEIMKLLIKNGANLETVDYAGRTPLYIAADFDNARAVEILLENGANPNVYNEKLKMSPLQAAFLHSAVVLSGEKIIDLLIQYGADVNQTDERGQTPLHKAVIGGHKKAIEMLIEKGVNVNAVDSPLKMTPLHYIVTFDSSSRGHENWTEDDRLKLIELLIDHGADVYAKAHVQDKDVTALDLASSKKVRKLLGSKMGFTGWLRTIW